MEREVGTGSAYRGQKQVEGVYIFQFPPPPKKILALLRGWGGKRKSIEEKRKRKGKVERG